MVNYYVFKAKYKIILNYTIFIYPSEFPTVSTENITDQWPFT